MGNGWGELERAAREATPVRVRVTRVDDTGASVDAGGVPGHVPMEELPFLPGRPPGALAGARVPALVTAASPAEDLLVLSPRALAARALEDRARRGRRARVHVVRRGPHGVLADAGGLRAWFAPDDPPRRRLVGGHAGWVVAVTSHLACLGGEQKRLAPSGAMTDVIEGVVLSATETQARVRLLQGGGAATAVVPRTQIAWHAVASAAAELRPGDRVRGRVIDLDLDGPVLSLREAAPSPWPAIALELDPGTEVRMRVRTVTRSASIARLVDHPHVITVVERSDVEPGESLTGVVEEVDVEAGRLHLGRVRTAHGG